MLHYSHYDNNPFLLLLPNFITYNIPKIPCIVLILVVFVCVCVCVKMCVYGVLTRINLCPEVFVLFESVVHWNRSITGLSQCLLRLFTNSAAAGMLSTKCHVSNAVHSLSLPSRSIVGVTILAFSSPHHEPSHACQAS